MGDDNMTKSTALRLCAGLGKVAGTHGFATHWRCITTTDAHHSPDNFACMLQQRALHLAAELVSFGKAC